MTAGTPGAGAAEVPSAAELLASAREVLLRQLLPLLPEDRRYDALLVASAIAIGQRSLQAAAKPSGDAAALVAAIRAGAHDREPAFSTTHAALRAAVIAALKVNNPKLLG
ncbi:MAG: hypothetical protein OHK0024_05810 [Thalassobaculales bacterium]